MSAAIELKALANPSRAFGLQKFFQTAKGQYGEGDVFLGLNVPEVRKVAARHKTRLIKECKYCQLQMLRKC